MRSLFLNPEETNTAKSGAVALGVFLGVVPIWGYQTVAALGLAHLFKLNKAITIIGSNISIPPLIPFIIYGSLQLGGFLLGKETLLPVFDETFETQMLKDHLLQYVIGSIVLASVLSVFLGFLTYILLEASKKTSFDSNS